MSTDSTTYLKTDKGMLEIPSIDQLCKALYEKFKRQEELITHYKTEYEKSKEKTFRDTLITDLNKELTEKNDLLANGFGITNEEDIKIKEWIKTHKHDKKLHSKDCSYTFFPTPLGSVGVVTCACGQSYQFREL